MTRTLSALALLVTVGSACVPDVGRRDRRTESFRQLLAAEDARPVDGRLLDFVIAAANAPDTLLRRTALRALGRFERPALVAEIAAHLGDRRPAVRATAVRALAQAVRGANGDAALEPLLARAAEEPDPVIRGIVASALGSLTLDASERRRVFPVLIGLSYFNNEDAPPAALLEATRGFESLIRRTGVDAIGGDVAERLHWLATWGILGSLVEAPRIRALALSSLGETRRVDVDVLRQALDDPHAEPRRIATRYLDAATPSARPVLLARALADESPRVVIGAIRYIADRPLSTVSCGHLITAAQPGAAPAVRVQALGALVRPCPGSTAQRRALVAAAGEIADGNAPWQPAASALRSLASVAPDAATSVLPSFVDHASPFVRSHAAVAGGALGAEGVLRRLADDPEPNVRTAAIRALFELEGHEIDDVLIAQLESDDPQLVLTAAGLLEGAPDRAAVVAATLTAFERISAAERETWRDPRRALLERVAEAGGSGYAERLEPYLADYDAVVAGDVAEILRSWTGTAVRAQPVPLAPEPPPTMEELLALRGAVVTLHMESGASLEITTYSEVAVRNVLRFVRLARDGYFDGLTFHRWAPNFVLQGGSPGANEYQGAARYSRDEIAGLAHWRGTVGISTRGRDTGDAQIFINLVDNPRLDPDYTVIGAVTGGLDELDTILEGAVIERAQVR